MDKVYHGKTAKPLSFGQKLPIQFDVKDQNNFYLEIDLVFHYSCVGKRPAYENDVIVTIKQHTLSLTTETRLSLDYAIIKSKINQRKEKFPHQDIEAKLCFLYSKTMEGEYKKIYSTPFTLTTVSEELEEKKIKKANQKLAEEEQKKKSQAGQARPRPRHRQVYRKPVKQGPPQIEDYKTDSEEEEEEQQQQPQSLKTSGSEIQMRQSGLSEEPSENQNEDLVSQFFTQNPDVYSPDDNLREDSNCEKSKENVQQAHCETPQMITNLDETFPLIYFTNVQSKLSEAIEHFSMWAENQEDLFAKKRKVEEEKFQEQIKEQQQTQFMEFESLKNELDDTKKQISETKAQNIVLAEKINNLNNQNQSIQDQNEKLIQENEVKNKRILELEELLELQKIEIEQKVKNDLKSEIQKNFEKLMENLQKN